MSDTTPEEVEVLELTEDGNWQKWNEDPQDYKVTKISREIRVLRSLVVLLTITSIALLAMNVWVLWFRMPSDNSKNLFISSNARHGGRLRMQTSNDVRDQFYDTNSTFHEELQKVQVAFTVKLNDSADQLMDVIRKMNTTLTEKVETVSKMPGPQGPKGVCDCIPSPRGGRE